MNRWTAAMIAILCVLAVSCSDEDHVFMESAGATAFLVGIHLDGEAGQLVIRMSPAGASAAITYARDSCGLGN